MDKYLLKVGIDLDDAQLSKVTGKISDQLVEMGKISNDFVDDALETAKRYNKELEKQRKIVSDIEARLRRGDIDPSTRKLLEETRDKANKVINDYTYGNEDEGIESKAVVDATAEIAKKAQNASDKLGRVFGKGTKMVSAFSAGIGIAKEAVTKFVNGITDALDKFSEYSNRLNPLGAFGNSAQRDLMSKYGMTGTQALGFQSVLDAMGMSESEIGRMTEEQRKVFNSLTNFWNNGIGKLDPDKLQRYTQAMQEYQEVQAKFNMGIQMMIVKLLTNSPNFYKLVGKINDLFDATLEFFDNPLVQKVFDGLISFLTTVVSLLEKAMRLVNFLTGSGQTINNNTTNNSNSTFNIYGTDFRSNDELARQISYSKKGDYRG